ncbi:MAG: hypothetical protein IPH37_18235 [Burkholderiales bacterium]|nr:hypothetical protein [Burkholderiales bacterium]
MLRFEGFSACCSTYIRIDMEPQAYAGEVVSKGTTNIDFNAPMRAALARVRDADGLALSVGRSEFALRSGGAEVVEKKVELPLRWLRSTEGAAGPGRPGGQARSAGGGAVPALRSAQPAQGIHQQDALVGGGKETGFAHHGTKRPPVAHARYRRCRLRVLQGLLPHAQSPPLYADAQGQPARGA